MARGSAARCTVALLAMLPMLAVAGALRNGHGSTMAVADEVRQDPEKMMATAESDAKKPEDGQKDAEQKFVLKEEYFTWAFWRPMVLAIGFLMLMSDVVARTFDLCLSHTLMKEACLFLFTMIGFAAVVFTTLDKSAAGMNVLVGAALMGAAFAILFAVFSCSIVAFSRDPKDPVKLILVDLSEGLRGLVRLIMLVTVEDIISQVAGVDWSRLALVLAFLLIAVALALAGVVGDLLAHLFIRFDQHFSEGDFILFDGDMVQIQGVHWRHTVGLSVPKQSVIYIPNNALTSSALINRTTDVSKKVKLMDEELKKLEPTEG